MGLKISSIYGSKLRYQWEAGKYKVKKHRKASTKKTGRKKSTERWVR